jgi:hypothetical protein
MFKSYREIDHKVRKLFNTLRLAYLLVCARTFGQYMHSGFNGEVAYARYRWRGEEWFIPTESIDLYPYD